MSRRITGREHRIWLAETQQELLEQLAMHRDEFAPNLFGTAGQVDALLGEALLLGLIELGRRAGFD